VRQQLVVRGRQRVEHQRLPRRVQSERVAVDGVHERLVEGDPQLHPVTEGAPHDVGIFAEACRGVPVEPAALVLQRLRQVPVEERGDRVDALAQERVDEAVVEVQSRYVRGPASGRLDPGPGDGEPVRVHAQPRQQVHVLLITVVVVTGDVPGLAGGDPVRFVHERVPDRRSAAVLGDRTLDLVGGGGRAPAEPLTHSAHAR
jgi:hypothetical protein